MDDKQDIVDEKRERTHTEKGLEYTLTLKQAERSRLIKALTVTSNDLKTLMQRSTDPNEVKPTYSKWLSEYEELLNIHDQYQRLTENPTEKQLDDAWFQERHDKFISTKQSAEQWFSVNSQKPARSVKSHRSSRSGSSRSSSVSSQLSMAKLKEEQRKAELLAREKSLDEKKFIEEEKLKLRFKEEALEIKTELQVTDAKTRVIEELEKSMLEDQQLEQIMVKGKQSDKVDFLNSQKDTENSLLNPTVPAFIPEVKKERLAFETKRTLKTFQSEQDDDKPPPVEAKNNIIDYNAQYSIARELNKPKADIQKFDGSPMNYKGFIRQFNARVETNTDSFEERINFLLQFTIGEPHRIVLGFSHLDAKIGYTAALNEFKDRYGDPDIIAHSYVQRAMNWPFIKADNPKALDDFAIFLQECMYAVNYVDAAKVLEYSENLKLLIQKLPFYMQEKWRNVVYETKSRKNIVTFSHLVEFVKKEAKKANDPVYGKDVLNTQVGKNVKRLQDNNMKYRSPGSKTAVTVTSEPKASTSSVGQQNETSSARYRNAFSKPCIYCENATHSLDKCDKVIKQSLKDRYSFLKSKGLCFSCLKYGHQKMSCRQKSSCTVCRKEHPSILHVEPRDQNQTSQQSESDQCPEVKNSTTFMGAGNSLRQALPILPVRVKSINSDNYIETYAFLDTGSTATFCTENIIRSLNIEGKKTKLSLVTMGQSSVHDCYVVTGLEISNLCGNDVISLPPVFSQETLPVTSNDIVFIEDIQKWSHLRDIPLQRIESEHIGLLIGINVPKAMEPWNVVPSIENGPFAVETLLGWVINGPLNVSTDDKPCKVASCNRIDVTSVSLEDQIRNQFNHDFNEKTIDDVVAPSKEDRRFLELVSKSIMLKDGHYVVNLPFKSKDNKMPNNRRQAEQRLNLLSRRFERDETFRDEYVTFMNKVIGDGFATEVSIDDLAKKDNDVWFLPHHGVFHPRKKKIRVVFDCAAKFQGTSLNERLLQGPNLTNTLIGTLIRFRQDEIAIMGDIDSMFHQVRVPSEDANYLRFLWWQGGDSPKKPTEYQMNVHLFGATSSPSCVNFALRKTTEDCNGQFNEEVINTVLRNFYVDDCLKSTKNVSEAVCLVQDLQSLLSLGGFRIAKWISNNREVMRSIPISDMAVGIKDLDLDQDTLPIDRALGIQWCAETDTFRFKISVKEQPKTRRGILSMVSSVYDPLGFLAPFVLRAKMILQELCRLRLDWDDPIPPKLESLFSLWFQDLHELSDFKVDRCLRPEKYGEIKNAQLHHFSDASESGYGTVTYLRLENTFGEIHCSFVMGKARVTPLKTITVPRLELTAATVALRTNKMLLNELEIPIDRSIFWTDSMSVLRYILNEDARFQTFVANRLAVIHDGSFTDNWRYVNTKLNPADHASRGLTSSEMKKRNWIVAPDFLWKDEDFWPKPSSENHETICANDPEVKQATVRTIIKTEIPDDNSLGVEKLIAYYSSWMSLKRSVAWILKVRKELLRRVSNKKQDNKMKLVKESDSKDCTKRISFQDLKDAEHSILVYVQRHEFTDEINTLSNNRTVKATSNIRKLDPVLDGDLLRVGGRLIESKMPENCKHPIILPKGHHISELILRQIHIDLQHSGRNHLLAHLRETYWLINAPSAVRKLISKCVVCRRLSAPVGEQKMANLPSDRITPDEPPFSRVGVDYFGPFEVKQRRCRIKRYGAIFTCLSSRAIHLEVAASLDTSSYINVLRRFIARRGQVEKIRSDNGTNFVGAERELKSALSEWNLNQIENAMLQKNIDWQFNPPAGSHFGGVWERLIRSVRKTMNSVIREQVLDDDGLNTVFCEIESTLNSRPITMNSDDPSDLEALTPNHLLLMKRKAYLPPGLFSKTDNYCRRKWRQIQYIANLFWSRWVREYLPMSQERQKWHKQRRNLMVGDIVIVVDSNAPRNSWPMGRINEIIPDRNGLVRQVKVKIGNNVLTRPVDKLCTLLELD